MPGPAYNPASFRDPEGRVFEAEGRVFRSLSDGALERMEALWKDGVLEALADDGLIIPTQFLTAEQFTPPVNGCGPALLEHARVPVVSYPYEWSFDMLRDGALLTLDLLERCLDHDLILKDGTALNVMPVGARMTFIDVLSIDVYEPGQPWEGYTQFCQEFLFPLMLTAYKEVDFRALLRGATSGVTASELAHLARLRDWIRPGFFKHVVLQAMLARSMEKKDLAVRGAFNKTVLPKAALQTTIRGLKRVIELLDFAPGDSTWIGYAEEHSYDAEARAAKLDFVRNAVRRLAPASLVDIGCNVGEYSMLAAADAKRVVALDVDPACVNALYLRLRDDSYRDRVLPLVADLTNPSPTQGWALVERPGLLGRVQSDAFLALALVHHICISANVPLQAFVDVLRQIAPVGVVEWVDKSDDMVQRLLRNRKDVFAEYTWDQFKAAVETAFHLASVQDSHGGRRKLCLLTPR
ncbi:MAG: methyltransferase [Alphaproteobacteria bacterium]|nr:methyltransferase [Alphaproteobacteria bacterium]